MKQFFDKFVQPLHKRVQEEGTSFVVVIIVLVVVFVLSGSFIARFRQDLHGSVMVNSFDFGLAKDDVFADVSRNHVNSFALAYLKGHGMVASGRDFFRPDEFATRAEFMKMLTDVLRVYPYKLSYGNCFNDVGDDWFAAPICYAKANGFVDGDLESSFGIMESINGERALEIVVNAFNLKNGDLSYLDIAEDKGWLRNLTGGFDFEPGKNLTRAEVAELLFRALKTEFPLH